MSSADYDNYTPYPIKKKFCKVCGAKLQTITKTVSYNEYDGLPVKILMEGVCPDQAKHDHTRALYGEDLDD